jgi:cytochrome c
LTGSRIARVPALAALAVMAALVLWAHLASGIPVFHSQVPVEPGWEKFRADYGVSYFGDDGQFVRAVQNGYNLFFHTYKYAPRFTRKRAGDPVNSCGSCHTAEDLAYGFVSSDRFDAALGKRLSFEDRVRWCYAVSVDGFVPTVYDPAVRDIRLMARAVAHHLQLSEGALRNED